VLTSFFPTSPPPFPLLGRFFFSEFRVRPVPTLCPPPTRFRFPTSPSSFPRVRSLLLPSFCDVVMVFRFLHLILLKLRAFAWCFFFYRCRWSDSFPILRCDHAFTGCQRQGLDRLRTTAWSGDDACRRFFLPGFFISSLFLFFKSLPSQFRGQFSSLEPLNFPCVDGSVLFSFAARYGKPFHPLKA